MPTSYHCSIFIIFLYFSNFSMHACNARNIRVRNADFHKEFLCCKIGERLKLDMAAMNSFQGSRATLIGHSPSDYRLNADSMFSFKPKKAARDQEEMKSVARTNSGKEVVESSSAVNFMKQTKVEASRLSAVHKEEGAAHNNDNGRTEDTSTETDYQPAHRNSPIHNK